MEYFKKGNKTYVRIDYYGGSHDTLYKNIKCGNFIHTKTTRHPYTKEYSIMGFNYAGKDYGQQNWSTKIVYV